MNLPILLVNANALTASIFDAAIAGTVQHEIVKKDVDCIIAEVGREGACVVCVCACVRVRVQLTRACNSLTSSPALRHDFPFPLLNLANYVTPHREQEFLGRKICLFRTDNFTIWVGGEHRSRLAKSIVQKAKAVTENDNAPCIARKEAPVTIEDAYMLLRGCEIATVTVMQYGQKADFGNKVVQWALTNVCCFDLFVCVSITD